MFMGMQMVMGQTLQQNLTLDQKLSIQIIQANLALQLAEAFEGNRYKPTMRCQGCGHKLTLLEILKGFRDDVNDFSVGCPKCGVRGLARNVTRHRSGTIELAFYCKNQTLNMLKDLGKESIDSLKQVYGAVYHSAVIHCGSIEAAFKQIGVEYPAEVKVNWKEKCRAFLGFIPDTKIAKVCNVSSYKVRKYRNSLGVKPYRLINLLEFKEN